MWTAASAAPKAPPASPAAELAVAQNLAVCDAIESDAARETQVARAGLFSEVARHL